MGRERVVKRARRLANLVSKELDADGTNVRVAKASEVFASNVVQTILRHEFERVDMRKNESVALFVKRTRELIGNLDGIDVIAHRGVRGISIRFVPTLATFAAARARVA